jgi:O-antigen/teichoic acid export membrane protein
MTWMVRGQVWVMSCPLSGDNLERRPEMMIRRFAATPETRDFLRRIGQTFTTRIALIGISLISSVIIARTLGPSGRGEYGVASVLAVMGAQFAMLGLHASNTYFLARDKERLPKLLGNSLVASAVAGGLVAGLLLVLIKAGVLSSLHGVLLWLAVCAVPVHAAAGLLQNLYLGLYDTRRYNRIDIVSNFANLAILTGLVGLGLETAVTVYGASLAVSVAMMLWMVIWLKGRAGAISVSWNLFRDNVGFSIRSYVSTLIMLLATRIDILMIEFFSDVEAVGYFAIAATLAELLGMLAVVAGSILFPRLSAERDAQLRWKLARQTAAVIAGVTAMGGVISVPLAGPVLVLLFGEQYVPSVTPYLLLLPGAVFLSTNVILMNYFAAEGMPPVVFVAPLVGFLVKLLLGVQLIPDYGNAGAAVAFSVSYLAMLSTSLCYIVYTRQHRLSAGTQ